MTFKELLFVRFASWRWWQRYIVTVVCIGSIVITWYCYIFNPSFYKQKPVVMELLPTKEEFPSTIITYTAIQQTISKMISLSTTSTLLEKINYHYTPLQESTVTSNVKGSPLLSISFEGDLYTIIDHLDTLNTINTIDLQTIEITHPHNKNQTHIICTCYYKFFSENHE